MSVFKSVWVILNINSNMYVQGLSNETFSIEKANKFNTKEQALYALNEPNFSIGHSNSVFEVKEVQVSRYSI